MTTLETLGGYVAEGVRGSVTPDLDDLLKLHVIDTVAAWVASATTAEAKQLTAYRPQLARQSSPLLADLTINSALARLTEVDDIHIASMTTPGAFIVPSALAIADHLGADAQTLLEAIVGGYEAMTRLGASLDGPTVLYRGIWPSYFSGAFGVAAVAARLMQLDARQAAHALALALNVAAPGVGHHGAPTTSRWLAAGGVARNGWLAAHAAAAGFTSDLGMLDGKYFAGVYNVTPDIAVLTRDLGERIALREVSFKPWCAARQTMAATQALKELLAGEKVDAARITAIEIAVPPSFVRMIDHGIVAGDRLSRLTSMPYQLGVAALAPEAAFDLAAASPIAADIEQFMSKVKVSGSENLLEGFPALWRARVRVQVGGTWLEHQIAQIPGDPGRPFIEKDVREKFHRLADRVAGADKVDRMISEALAVLDGIAPPRQLLALVV
jgi:2-methylcitrate dehydratase PrpD